MQQAPHLYITGKRVVVITDADDREAFYRAANALIADGESQGRVAPTIIGIPSRDGGPILECIPLWRLMEDQGVSSGLRGSHGA